MAPPAFVVMVSTGSCDTLGALLEESASLSASTQLTTLPPTVVLRELGSHGKSLVAASVLPAAAAVIEGEAPLLKVGAELREGSPAQRAAARLCAYAAADESTRHVVLAELCRPSRQDPGAADHWEMAEQVVTEALALPGVATTLAAHEVVELVEVYLSWVFNSHAFFGGEAVFRVGSKLNHSCAPNTVWRTWGRAGHAHVALRPVACGEEVFTSYLDVGCAMREGVWSTAARRRLLARTKLFWCDCVRCSREELEEAATIAALSAAAAPCGAAGVAAAAIDEVERLEEHTISLAARVNAAAGRALTDDDALPPVVGSMVVQAHAAAALALSTEHWAVVRLDLALGQFHAASLQQLARALSRTVEGDGDATVRNAWTRRSVTAAFEPHVAQLRRLAPVVWSWALNQQQARRRKATGEKAADEAASAAALLWRPFQMFAAALAEAVQALGAHDPTNRLWPPTECLLGALRCAEQLVKWIMPGCEEWPEEAGRVDPAMTAAGLLRTRGQLEAQMSQLTVLLKAVELAAHSVDLDTQLRECEEEAYEEAYEEGKQKGDVAAAAAAAEGRRFICLSIASARGDLQSLHAAARSLPQHGLGTMLVSVGESQVALLAHVPEDLAASHVPCSRWMSDVLNAVQGLDDDGISLGASLVNTFSSTEAAVVRLLHSSACAARVTKAVMAAALSDREDEVASQCSDDTLMGDAYFTSEDES